MQRTKPKTPTQAIDAFIGDEEQNGKQKKETGNVGTGSQPSYLSVACYDPHGSYGEPLLFPVHKD